MGLFDKGSQQTTAKPPDYVKTANKQAIGIAQGIAQQPYVQYPGQRVAGMSGNEQLAYNQAGGDLNRYDPQYQAANMYATAGAAPVNYSWLNNYQNYINPYWQTAVEPAVDAINKQYAIANNQDAAQSAMQGAFGGARTGLRESNDTYNRIKSIGDLYKQGGAEAYQQALQPFQTDLNTLIGNRAAISGAANQFAAFPGQEAATRAQGYQQLQQTGALNRAIQQQALDTAYQDYLTQRDWASRGLNAYNTALQGVPSGIGTTTQQQNINPLTAITGAALTGLGTYWGSQQQPYYGYGA